jgi:hypothetical protein
MSGALKIGWFLPEAPARLLRRVVFGGGMLNILKSPGHEPAAWPRFKKTLVKAV